MIGARWSVFDNQIKLDESKIPRAIHARGIFLTLIYWVKS